MKTSFPRITPGPCINIYKNNFHGITKQLANPRDCHPHRNFSLNHHEEIGLTNSSIEVRHATNPGRIRTGLSELEEN